MERTEKKTILFSLLIGIVLLCMEIAMAIYTHSQAMVMDALYDTIDVIIVIVTLFLVNLYNRPISEKKPFGFLQLESFFILLKTFMILSLNISIIINAILLIKDGGKEIDVTIISIFQFILFIGNLITWLIIRKINKKINSPTVKSEVLAWKSDAFYSLGLSIAFFAVQFLKGTRFNNIIIYFDQIVVIVTSMIMIPDLVKLLKENITSVLLFAPNDELVGQIKKIVESELSDTKIKLVHYDIIKTGRKIWVSVYFKTSSETVDLNKLKEKTILCSETLNEKIGDIYFELVPEVED